jgi:hypothetical protein
MRYRISSSLLAPALAQVSAVHGRVIAGSGAALSASHQSPCLTVCSTGPAGTCFVETDHCWPQAS